MGVGEEPVCRATPGRGAGPWGPCQTGADHPPPRLPQRPRSPVLPVLPAGALQGPRGPWAAGSESVTSRQQIPAAPSRLQPQLRAAGTRAAGAPAVLVGSHEVVLAGLKG